MTSSRDRVAQLDRVIKDFKFSGFMSLLNLKLEVGALIYPDMIRVIGSCKVPDRDTPEHMVALVIEHAFSLSVPRTDEQLVYEISHWLSSFWRHEFNESLQYKGQRLVDPHKNDPVR